jgi:hypothetical protein
MLEFGAGNVVGLRPSRVNSSQMCTEWRASYNRRNRAPILPSQAGRDLSDGPGQPAAIT